MRLVYVLLGAVFVSILVFSVNSGVGIYHVASRSDFNGDVMRFGVNYFSTHNHYEPYYLQDEELDRDFSLFRQQGLQYVTLAIVWAYHEPQLGEYNEQALDDVIRVCDFAAKYDLKVVINFYTMMTEGGWWTMPYWLSSRDFETVFTNETAHTAWLNFLDHCASRLNQTSSIWSWHMMNEPARSWGADVSIDAYLDLWAEMKNIFKSYSERPVSVRFAAQTFNSITHFNRDPRIYDLLDYLTLNWYENHCSREILTQIVTEAQEHTDIFISEFGYNTLDDAEQAENYASYIAFFKDLRLTDYVAWIWRADYHLGNPDLPGEKFNLAKDVNGTPRSAFYLLVPQELPTQYKLEVSTIGEGTTNATRTNLFNEGKQVVVQASANLGWSLSHWLLDGVVAGSANPFMLTMNGNHSLTAVFSQSGLEVTVVTDRARYTKWSYIHITVAVSDRLNGVPIQDVTVDLTVYDTHGRVVWTANAITNPEGMAKFVYKLVFNAQMGNYTVAAAVSLAEYQPSSGQASFYSLG